MARDRNRSPRRSAEGGYNMVALCIIILVMNIAVATALPRWSTLIQREKEEELIFRGLQYAEAIRVFQKRHGRLPVKLDELVKTEPRSIRQLWVDPITDSTDWGLVLSAGPNRSAAVAGQGASGRDREKGGRGNTQADLGLPGSSNPDLPKGPIQGVFSRSTDSSIKVFLDQQRYSDWKFTVDLLAAPGGPTPGRPSGHVADLQKAQTAGPPRFNVKWLGRPFRPGVQPIGPGGAGPGNGGRNLGGSVPGGSQESPSPGRGGKGRG